MRESLLSFKDSLIEAVGKRQAPAMFSYIFHKAVQGWFNEQSTTNGQIDPPDLVGDVCTYNMRGTLNFLPSGLNVPAINTLSQRSYYQLIKDNHGGSWFGGGGGITTISTNGGGSKVQNPNCYHRFNASTIFAGKIKNIRMIKIIERANIISSIPVGKDGQERCITYHAKGGCMSKCNHAYDHKSLSVTANAELFGYVSDGYH